MTSVGVAGILVLLSIFQLPGSKTESCAESILSLGAKLAQEIEGACRDGTLEELVENWYLRRPGYRFFLRYFNIGPSLESLQQYQKNLEEEFGARNWALENAKGVVQMIETEIPSMTSQSLYSARRYLVWLKNSAPIAPQGHDFLAVDSSIVRGDDHGRHPYTMQELVFECREKLALPQSPFFTLPPTVGIECGFRYASPPEILIRCPGFYTRALKEEKLKYRMNLAEAFHRLGVGGPEAGESRPKRDAKILAEVALSGIPFFLTYDSGIFMPLFEEMKNPKDELVKVSVSRKLKINKKRSIVLRVECRQPTSLIQDFSFCVTLPPE